MLRSINARLGALLRGERADPGADLVPLDSRGWQGDCARLTDRMVGAMHPEDFEDL